MKFTLLTLLSVAFFGVYAQITYPPNMYADSLHAPFYYGVASGDPMPDRVIIWAHITPAVINAPEQLSWQISTDSNFTAIAQSGTITVDTATDYCAKVDVTGLQPYTHYFYRFTDSQNRHSITGRTLTAPVGNNSSAKFAVVSCSSIFSGYFNAYRQIANRSDVDVVIHLGDYIYDFVDPDEEVRLPNPYPQQPTNFAEWCARHAYYLLDPDLRLARQMKPLIVTWDNHDIAGSDRSIPARAFLNWNPVRIINAAEPQRIYRKLSYGNLADIITTDLMRYRGVDEFVPGQPSVLGTEQYNWLLDTLGSASGRWKIFGSPKMFSYFGLQSFQGLIPGGAVNLSGWDSYPLERSSILHFIDSLNINNVFAISGDSHISVAAELTDNPADSTLYDPITGAGALGVEFLPSSISRGNLDEAGVPLGAMNSIAGVMKQENKHVKYVELSSHGYGLLIVTPDSIAAQFWYCPILQQTNTQTLARHMVVLNGQNKWKRDTVNTGISEVKQRSDIKVSAPYPNPTTNTISVEVTVPKTMQVQASVYHVKSFKAVLPTGTDSVQTFSGTQIFTIPISNLAAGAYILTIQADGFYKSSVFVKQ
jgi:alkaline phosphatase D